MVTLTEWAPPADGRVYRLSLQREGEWVADSYGFVGEEERNPLAEKVIHHLTGGVHVVWRGRLVLVARMETIREVNLQVL